METIQSRHDRLLPEPIPNRFGAATIEDIFMEPRGMCLEI